ncbi:MAG: MFS transporter [Clostridia bacterium]|nr:MFS transporter [Clostridia bacterium]MBQ4604589.1 MFS transporter [Clostridia bacterium]
MTALLIVIYIAFVSLGFPDSLFGVTWPVVHLEFGLPESFGSVYSVVTAVSTGGIAFIAGPLLRKFGTGRVTFFSTLLTALGLIGISFSPNIIVMMICTIIMGYGAGAIDTGLNNFVSLHYKAKHMNWLHCCWGLGVTISPMIMSAFLGGDGTWRGGYRVVALIQFAIALIILASLKKWNVQPKAVAETESAQKELPKKSFLDLLKEKGMVTSILSLGLYCAGEFTIGTWGATYAVNVLAISPDEAAKWISLYFCGIMVGRIIAGFLSEKLSDNTLIKGGMVIAAVGMIVMLLPIGKTALVGLLLIGMGYGPVFPSVLHSVPARFGAEYSADITGYHMSGAYGIGFAIQFAFGYIASATTFAIMPFMLLAFGLGVIGTTIVTLRKLKKSEH